MKIPVQNSRQENDAVIEEQVIINQFIDSIESDDAPKIPVNIYENEEEYRIDLLSPGFTRDDFTIDLNEDYLLTISAKSEEEEDSNELVLKDEFEITDFTRLFKIPTDVLEEEIDVYYKNGILTVIIPKTSYLESEVA